MINNLIKKHPEIVLKMLDRQEEQGNERNWQEFEKSLCAEASEGGFNWKETEEGYSFWEDVLALHKYDKFYKMYPSKELKYLPEDYIPSGDLEDIPVVIIDELMKQALLQNSSSIIEDFEEDKGIGSLDENSESIEGMVWEDSKQGHDFWEDILERYNFTKYTEVFPFKAFIVEDSKDVLVLCKGINSNGKYLYKKRKDPNIYSTSEIFLNRTINSYRCFTEEDFKRLEGKFVKNKNTGELYKITGVAEDINKNFGFILNSSKIVYTSDLLKDYTFTDDSPCGKISS